MPISITHVDFVPIATQDRERSRRFYLETLRLPLGIWQPESFGMPFQPTPNALALHVDDVAAARAELEAAGVTFEGDIFDTSVCHMAFFKDPDGNAFMLHHRYAPRT